MLATSAFAFIIIYIYGADAIPKNMLFKLKVCQYHNIVCCLLCVLLLCVVYCVLLLCVVYCWLYLPHVDLLHG